MTCLVQLTGVVYACRILTRAGTGGESEGGREGPAAKVDYSGVTEKLIIYKREDVHKVERRRNKETNTALSLISEEGLPVPFPAPASPVSPSVDVIWKC